MVIPRGMGSGTEREITMSDMSQLRQIVRELEDDRHLKPAELLRRAADDLEKLPVVKTGERVIPGMGICVFHPDKSFVGPEGVRHGHPLVYLYGIWSMWGYHASECYLTAAEADEAAQKEGGG